MPPQHHRHPQAPHAHQWFYNSEGTLTPQQFGDLLGGIAGSLAADGTVRLGDQTVALPAGLHAVVRYERSPRGELVLKLEAKWVDGPGSNYEHPIVDLLPGGSGAGTFADDSSRD